MSNHESVGVSRRDLLRAGVPAFLVAVSMAGCDRSTEPEGPGGTVGTKGVTKPKESPMLAAQVAAGTLPALADRLPKTPPIVEPVDRIGRYGGDWHGVFAGRANLVVLYLMMGYEQLMGWEPSFNGEVLPNIAESVDASADGREYTFHLREGMRWSDGEPFTADDIVFAVADVMFNEELFPTKAGLEAPVEKLDDLTVRFTFDEPDGLFVKRLATPGGQQYTLWPKHYLAEFHLAYNPDAEEMAKAEGLDSWTQLFDVKSHYSNVWAQFENPDLPTLKPRRVTSDFEDGTRIVFERNPYYWKTDPDGGQLPYIDRLVFEDIGDPQAALLRAASGEIDLDIVNVNSLSNKPVLAQSREEGRYDFFEAIPSSMNVMAIGFNLTHQDPNLREIFNNLDFRVGLSYAINRQEIIDTVYQRQGESWGLAPRPESPFYDEEFAKLYTEYDVDLANEHLDKAGYTERDESGLRLAPDGKRISFRVDVDATISAAGSEHADVVELVSQYWAEVGVEVSVNSLERGLYYTRKTANEHDANVVGGGAGLYDALFDPRWYMPTNTGSHFAIPWANWRTPGVEPSEEPPEAPKRQIELYKQLSQTPDEQEQDELFTQILQIAKEQFYGIGIALPAQGFGIVKNNFHNVPDSMTNSWMYPNPGPTHPEQYFISEE